MMATYNNNAHPLPSAPVGGASMQPPQPQLQPQTQTAKASNANQIQSQTQNNRSRTMARDRRSRGMSFRSDKSHHSASGSVSIKLEPETHAEKEAKRLHSKADPTLAMFEAEPSAVAASVKTSLAPLRSIVHRDSYGNPIAEPDKTNPTRSRWERPLDTIRSFEAAIDGGYSRKPSYADSEANNNVSRRNSYFSAQGTNPNTNTAGPVPGPGGSSARYPQDSYYRGQPPQPPQMSTSSSAYDLRQTLHGRDSYYDYQGAPPQAQHMQPRQRYSRMASEPQIHGRADRADRADRPDRLDHPVYPGGNNNHRSYETVASGAGSNSNGEPAGYQTDPTSSDNSSIERRQSPGKMAAGMGAPGAPGQFNRRPSPMNDLSNGGYGYNNNNSANTNNSYSGYNAPSKGPQIQLNGAAPVQAQAPVQVQVPAPAAAQAAAPTKNVITRKATNAGAAAPLAVGAAPAADKRKSWLSRKFSKKN